MEDETIQDLRARLERLEFEKVYAYENMETLQKELDESEKTLRIERNLRRDIEHLCHSYGIKTPSSDPEEKGMPKQKKDVFEDALMNENAINEMKKEVEAVRLQNAKLKRRIAKEYMENAHLQTSLLALEKELAKKPIARSTSPKPPLLSAPTHDSIVVRSPRGAEGGNEESDENYRDERKREREERRLKRNLEVAKLKLEESEEKRKLEKEHHQREITRLKEEYEGKLASAQ
mmetsp:Transcript_21818/g.33904  ORF Transcript_21818/g.33904 Transcript_21818/m.33904 type:complete len:233 (-) Transcript_21818:68-766(-)|eukprot:CAMPEP_0201536282 /NCGR_PEP_ID=MMETSP0161_2-20130828/61386_1 /ASSEMBLY_ACC=CAM_ASM_000251 /TAXON_ID=180227 /ORGANISM="Neoparamoeba aestuarina, Strain SoJaBio B1-5/56/2" /LENGTH=232 /DNA_ID=CAMNT_0047941887 /DNA_START=133 /DNA_END=831 /DNA_ORIENTATION=-